MRVPTVPGGPAWARKQVWYFEGYKDPRGFWTDMRQLMVVTLVETGENLSYIKFLCFYLGSEHGEIQHAGNVSPPWDDVARIVNLMRYVGSLDEFLTRVTFPSPAPPSVPAAASPPSTVPPSVQKGDLK